MAKDWYDESDSLTLQPSPAKTERRQDMHRSFQSVLNHYSILSIQFVFPRWVFFEIDQNVHSVLQRLKPLHNDRIRG